MGEQILVPIKGMEDQCVELPDDAFTEDPSAILGVLQNEKPPLDVWWRCALRFHRKGHIAAYLAIASLFDTDRDSNLPVPMRTPEDKRAMVALSNSLASYHIGKARQEKDTKARDDHYSIATRLFHRADRTDSRFPLTLLGKALFHLYHRAFDKARQTLKMFVDQIPDSKVGRLLTAVLDYHEGKYEPALETISAVLTDRYGELLTASVPPDQALAASSLGVYSNVRPAIAHLWTLVRNPERAALALKRQRSLTPHHEATLVALGTLLLNQYNLELSRHMADTAVGKQSAAPNAKMLGTAMSLARSVFEKNSMNPIAANMLSNYAFLSKPHDEANLTKVQDLAVRAYNITRDPKVRAEAAYFRGRVAHARGDYADAFQLYSESVRLWEEFPLGNFGLAQLLIQRREYQKATTLLEAVLKRVPDNFECLKMLGSLSRESGVFDVAEQHLTQAQRLRPRDFEVALELAIVLERRDVQKAAEQYNNALSILHDAERATVAPELWNNVAVTRQRSGDTVGARDAFVRALIAVASTDNAMADTPLMKDSLAPLISRPSNAFLTSEEFNSIWTESLLNQDAILLKPANISISFNIAVLFEEMTETQRAIDLHKRIVAAQPQYVDCWIRLGQIAQGQGQFGPASDYYKEVVAVVNQHAGAWTMLANLHMEKHEYDAAQKVFDTMLQHNKQDPYALVQYANLFLQAAQSNPDKKDRYLDKAEEWFVAVLKKDPHNVFAANGLGVVLARRGLLADARDVFSMVEDTFAKHGASVALAQYGELPVDVLVNAGNVHFELHNWPQACLVYEKALERASPQLASDLIMPLIARCYFEDGKIAEARAFAAKACRAAPWKLDNWFNFALCLKDSASKLLNSPQTTSTKLKTHALPYLQTAVPIFAQLEKPAQPDKRAKYNTKKASHSLRLCNGQIDTIVEKIKELEETENAQREAQRLREQRLREFEEERKRKEQLRLQEEELRRQQLEEKLREADAFRAQVISRIEERQREIQAAEAAKAKQVDDLVAEGDDGRPSKRKKKGRKNKQEKVLSGEEYEAGADDMQEQPISADAALELLKQKRNEKRRLTRNKEDSASEDEKPESADIDALFDDAETPADGEPEVTTRLKRKRSVVDDDDEVEEAADDTPKESEAKRPKADETAEAGTEPAPPQPEHAEPMNTLVDDDIYPPEMTAEADAMLAD